MANFEASNYVGRFAPSPTGPLHIGSLVAALASYIDARKNRGVWLVRIEDIDPPREVPGATDAILQSLEQHGLCWDREVIYQSRRTERYESALDQLAQQQRTFRCSCSRQELQRYSIYPGTCRDRSPDPDTPCAIRLKTDGISVRVDDLVQGIQRVSMDQAVGDFVVKRKDSLYAYQLAVAVDDMQQGITRVVRGADLLDSSCKQITLMKLLGGHVPEYAHVPVVVNASGEKLSKQTHAKALRSEDSSANLKKALAVLGHPLPRGLVGTAPEKILAWATENWQIGNIPREEVCMSGN